MKKVMISQPMNGISDVEITATRNRAMSYLNFHDYELVNTLFSDDLSSSKIMTERGVTNIPLCFLAKSLEQMSLCDAVYFCKGWELARGCRIEHEAALKYGLKIIYEE